MSVYLQIHKNSKEEGYAARKVMKLVVKARAGRQKEKASSFSIVYICWLLLASEIQLISASYFLFDYLFLLLFLSLLSEMVFV